MDALNALAHEAGMRIEYITREHASGLQEWDDFLMKSPRGHYGALSTWLKSFCAYGFEFGVVVAKDSTGQLCGGAGVVMFRRLGFTVISVPVGPIVEQGAESLAQPIVEAVYERGRALHAALVQFTVPCCTEQPHPGLLSSFETDLPVQDGLRFRTANVPNQLLYVDLSVPPEAKWRDEMLKRMRANTRNRTVASERQNITVVEAREASEVRQGYKVIEENGRVNGYHTRSWGEFGPYLTEQIIKGHAKMLVAYHNGEAVSSSYGVLAGKRHSNVMAGTLRVAKGLSPSNYLIWNAMQRAHDEGLSGFDFTSDGPPSVLHFKMGYRPVHYRFIEPKYLVPSKTAFFAFESVYPVLRRRKAAVAKLLRNASAA